MKSSLARCIALVLAFVALLSAGVVVPYASAQRPDRPDRDDAIARDPRALPGELDRTDAIIRDARAAVGDAPAARELLRNAVDHQSRARALFNAGRPVPAAQETLLARRLAERAMNPAGPGEQQDIERVLRRIDRRVQLAAEWLRNHPDAGADATEDLATAQRQLDRAWDAYRAGQNAEALKHAATVRQILGDLPIPPDREGGDRVIVQLDATDRLIEAMSHGLREPYASQLDAARGAQRRARERLAQGRPAIAVGLGFEARAHAVRVWLASGSAPDRQVTEALLDANRLTLDDLDLLLSGDRADPSSDRELAAARSSHAAAVRSLGEDNVGDAWRLALETSRHLWTIAQNVVPDNGAGLRR